MHVDMMDLSGAPAPACRMVVIGVGGGGCSSVQHMEAGWKDGPICIGLDADAQVMAQTSLTRRLEIGRELTQGQGAGGDRSVGKLAAEDDREAIRDLVADIDLLVLIVALGGGTGTGAAPEIAKAARERGATVLAFATLPFSFEGEDRRRQAQLGLRDLRLHSDAVIVQPNDRLLESTSEAEALVAAFVAADAMVGVGVRALYKVLTEPGILNIGFSDLRQLIAGSGGTCTFGYAMGHGTDRADQAIRDLMTSPTLDRGAQIAKAGALMVNVCGGADVTLTEIQRIMDQIRSVATAGAHMLLGYSLDPALDGHLSVTVLVAESWVEDEPREQERDEEPASDSESTPAAEAEGLRSETSKSRGRSRADRKRRQVQAQMADAKDRFSVDGVAPSFHEGQDLDIPTFIRKNVKLSERN